MRRAWVLLLLGVLQGLLQGATSQAEEGACVAEEGPGVVPARLANLVRYAQSVKHAAAAEGRAREEDDIHRVTDPEPLAVPRRLSDNFDPGDLSLWETVQGGEINGACGAVTGEALCFDGEPSRLVVMTEMDSTEGGRVHFSMRMLEDGAPAAVVLEHKTLGAPWKAISTMGVGMTDRSAEAAGGGFVRHAVDIPAEAQSQATHLRWRQLPLKGPGAREPRCRWALDDVHVELVTEAPTVWLSAATDVSAGGDGLAVRVRFSVPVVGFESNDVMVQGGTVERLSEQPSALVGREFLLLISTAGRAAGSTTVRVPEAVCVDTLQHVANRASNTLDLCWVGGSSACCPGEECQPRLCQACAPDAFEPSPAAHCQATVDALARQVYDLEQALAERERLVKG